MRAFLVFILRLIQWVYELTGDKNHIYQHLGWTLFVTLRWVLSRLSR